MQVQRDAAPGFDTQLDLANLDEISAAEQQALLDWYERSHADGESGLTDFVGFLIVNRPRALKLYRAYAQALDEQGGLPQLVVALLFLRYYMTVGNDKGVRYEVVAARAWGATKAEVLDTIESGFVVAGPFGLNAAATSQPYLSTWADDEPRRVADPWPASWRGAQLPAAEQTATDRVLGRHAPTVLAAMTARRAPVTGKPMDLPAPMIALLDLHQAVADCLPAQAAAAAGLALEMGLSVAELMEVVGFGALYTTPAALDAVAEALEPVLAAEAAEGSAVR